MQHKGQRDNGHITAPIISRSVNVEKAQGGLLNALYEKSRASKKAVFLLGNSCIHEYHRRIGWFSIL